MVNKAITFALKAHENQFRKGTMIPYIVHPVEVMAIVARMTDDEEVLAAAVLHDTLEDCKDVTSEMIQTAFGDRVLRLVMKESEDKSLTWQQRKQRTMDRLRKEDCIDTLMIALADKLSNIRSLVHDYASEGESVWNRFRMKDKTMQGWYYKGLCGSLKKMENYAEYAEFCELVFQVFE